ncbi:MAG: hypothetical protein HRT58_22360 [Crocinitomicaceae bacterium]|nr:hypothetical protein [Flavobacteriales bacterium]NQZ38421.1 hypothetical protein [Crocinitomicaceae bacterium]
MILHFQFINNTEYPLTFQDNQTPDQHWEWIGSPPKTISSLHTVQFSLSTEKLQESVIGKLLFTQNQKPLNVTFEVIEEQINIQVNNPEGLVIQYHILSTPLSIITLNVSNDNSRWMEEMAEQIANKPLHTVCLPGTHDSATYDISTNSEISPDAPVDLYNIEPFLKGSWINPIVKNTIANWAVSQPQTIAQQLTSGIRYLDLRLWWDCGEIWLVHSMTSITLSSLVDQIEAFVQDNPKEILLLDFNHFYGFTTDCKGNKMSPKAQQLASNAYAQELSRLADYLIPQDKGVNVTLSELWKEGKSIIAFNAGPDISAYNINTWSEEYIQSTWTNTQNSSALKSALDKVIEKKPSDQFWVLQSILTPDTNTILNGLNPKAPNSLKELATNFNPEVQSWLQNDWNKSGLNIIIIDWAISIPYLSIIKQINRV